MSEQSWKGFCRLLSFICFFVFVGSLSCYAADKQVDAVWVEADGIRHEIFFSTFSEGTWSDPVQLTDDYFDNLHPVVDRDSHGKHWVFWTASDAGKLTLHYTSSTDDGWADIKEVPVELNSSIAPSVVIAADDVLWLAWAGNTGGQDDIYVTTLHNGEWGKAVMVHPENEVPDILPTITLDAAKQLSVRWKTFQNGAYVTVQSTWDGRKWSSPEQVEAVETTAADSLQAEKDIPVPEFLKDDDRAFVRLY